MPLREHIEQRGFQGTGVLRKIVLDNLEDGEVKFVSASPYLTNKLNS